MASEKQPRQRFVSISLRVVVFMCGGILMAVEIMGSRVLAPFFGSDIFVWGSLIGVVLAALSIGYYLGGIIADKVPRFSLLGAIIVAAGVYLLLLPLFGPSVCESARQNFEIAEHATPIPPLVACVILFLLPGILLGIVSPFAIKLAAKSLSTVGGVAGALYALSTLGSIIGTMLTSFVLNSYFRQQSIITALGAVLVAVGILALATEGYAGGYRLPAWILALVVLTGGALAFVPKPPALGLTYPTEYEVLEEAVSPYHQIMVVRSKVPGTASRWRCDLHFDKYIESGIYLNADGTAPAEPLEPATDYTDLLHLPMIFREPESVKRVLFIGGGGGVGPTTYLRDYRWVNVEVVEINREVVRLAQKYFAFTPEGERIHTHILDGRNFLRDTTNAYDVIIFDAFSTGGRPPFHLLTAECLKLARERLTEDGVVLTNIIGEVTGPRSRLFRSEFRTYCSVFGSGSCYAFRKSKEGGNIILLGTKFARRFDKETLVTQARSALNAGKIKIRLLPYYAEYYMSPADADLESVPVLTDDFAPVDMMVAY